MIIPREIKLTAGALLAMAILLLGLAGRWWLRPDPDPLQKKPVVASISIDQYRSREQQLLAAVELAVRQRDGFRGALDKAQARLRGLELLVPDSILVVDTVRIDVDTAIVQASFDIFRGLEVFAGTDRDSTGAYRPRIVTTKSAAGCERIVIRGTQAVCKRPPFGHAELMVRAGIATSLPKTWAMPADAEPEAEIGIRWVPSLVSSWAVESSIDIDQRWVTSVERSLRLW